MPTLTRIEILKVDMQDRMRLVSMGEFEKKKGLPNKRSFQPVEGFLQVNFEDHISFVPLILEK